jgi:carbon-monoxide dehydrogenase iron sulfur subunit
MKKSLVVDFERCTGCRICEVACSLHHEKAVNTTKSRIHVVKIKNYVDVPLVCQQCETPLCSTVCPTKAIYRDTKTNALLVNHDLCVGCRLCIAVCPFGGCSWDAERGKVVRCDLCNGDPLCAKMCPTGALRYVTVTRYVLLKKLEAANRLSELIKKFVLTSAGV